MSCKHNELPTLCQYCVHLKAFGIHMDGSNNFSCQKAPLNKGYLYGKSDECPQHKTSPLLSLAILDQYAESNPNLSEREKEVVKGVNKDVENTLKELLEMTI